MKIFIRIISYGSMATFALFVIFMAVFDYKNINGFAFFMLILIFLNAFGFIKLMFKKDNDQNP